MHLALLCPDLGFSTCGTGIAFPMNSICCTGSEGAEESTRHSALRTAGTPRGTSCDTNNCHPYLPTSRLNDHPTQAPKFKFRGPSKEVTLGLGMTQVHVNEATVQRAEVKGRTGRLGFSMHEVTKETPPRGLNSQRHKGSLVPRGGGGGGRCLPALLGHSLHTAPHLGVPTLGCIFCSPWMLCRKHSFQQSLLPRTATKRQKTEVRGSDHVSLGFEVLMVFSLDG